MHPRRRLHLLPSFCPFVLYPFQSLMPCCCCSLCMLLVSLDCLKGLVQGHPSLVLEVLPAATPNTLLALAASAAGGGAAGTAFDAVLVPPDWLAAGGGGLGGRGLLAALVAMGQRAVLYGCGQVGAVVAPSVVPVMCHVPQARSTRLVAASSDRTILLNFRSTNLHHTASTVHADGPCC